MLNRHVMCLALVAVVAIAAMAAAHAAAPWPRTQHWQNSLKPMGAPAHELTLAFRGSTNYTIVIPRQATTMEQKAAEDLAQWLHEMTGAEYPVLDDSCLDPQSEGPRPARMISIGKTLLTSGARAVTRADLGDEGYSIAVRGNNLLLLGGRKRGPINAVYAFLEEDLGLRWYTTKVSRIPRRPTVRVRPVPRTYVPPLTIRDPFYKDAFDGTWSLRNRTNAPSASIPEEWGGHTNYALFVHTYNTLVPPGQYFEENPDLFMQNADGKRIPRQLCHTNPETIRIATESCLRILRDKPDCEVISVSKNDGGGSCVCDACRAIDQAEGTDCGSLLHFVNKVAEGVEKEFPEVTISTLAYLETVKPPKTIRPRKNVAIRLCTDRCMWSRPFTPARDSEVFSQAMEGWSQVHDSIHIWDYCVNFSHYSAPMPNMEAIADNIRYFVAHNATGVMEQGAYQSSGGERELMRCWVFAKLLWDPSLDVNKLMHDFIWGYYAEAAGPIQRYNELLQATARKHAESMANPKGGIRYPMDSEFLSGEFLSRATALFDEAEQLARSNEILRRVELARLPIIYVKLCQGVERVGKGYLNLVERFEDIARREGMTHLREGGPDLDAKIKGWRDSVRVQRELDELRKSKVVIWALPPQWKFAPDPDDVGEREGYGKPGLDDAGWATVRTDTGSGWETQGFADYTGYGWYRQQLTVPTKLAAKHLYLYFGAVDEDAYVFINGQQAAEHSCKSTGLSPDVIWLTPFSLAVRDRLRLGAASSLAVRVYNRLGMGGVYKPVYLIGSDREIDAPIISKLLETRGNGQ